MPWRRPFSFTLGDVEPDQGAMVGNLGRVWGSWPFGWTGGQYSIFRVLLGGFLLSHFVQLSLWAWDLPSGFVLAVTLVAAVASLLFIVGIADRWAALFLGLALVYLYGRNPALPKASVTPLVWMLLAHLLMRKAPYGSLAARGRPDPGAGWRFPAALVLGTWLLLAWSYLLAGQFLKFGPQTVAGSIPAGCVSRSVLAGLRFPRFSGPAAAVFGRGA